tara:strand:+ start:100261 stop:100506 length:246 start_codon:yes stop_codon:yes gene_type:complete
LIDISKNKFFSLSLLVGAAMPRPEKKKKAFHFPDLNWLTPLLPLVAGELPIQPKQSNITLITLYNKFIETNWKPIINVSVC